MSLKRLSRVFGSIFDVVALSEIPDDDCHVIFVSGRTLYLMQHFGNNEVNFLARYADSFSDDGRYYDAVDLDSPNVDLVQRIAQDYRLEVLDMQCSEIITAIENLTAQVGLINTNVTNANDCGCDGTSFDESELNNGDIQAPGQAYLDGKCRTANVLHDRVRNFASTMDTLGVDNILNLGVGLATSIVAGLVLAGPGGWATLLVIGVVSGILLLLVDLTAGQFGDLVTELDENQDDLVCALVTAGSAIEARESYLEVLDAQAVGEPVQQVVAFMLTNSVTNQLFVPSGAYLEGTDWLNDGFTPTDCDNCAGPVIFARLPEYPNSEEKGGTGDLTLNNAPRDLTATLDENGFYYVTIRHVNHGSEFSCNYQGTSLSAGDGRGWAWYDWDGDQNVLIDEAEESQDPMPPQVLGNVSAVVWIGVSSFTVTVRLVAAT